MDFSNELSPETRVKMKKNLLYVGIFSIVMLFAGLTFAFGFLLEYLIYWVKFLVCFLGASDGKNKQASCYASFFASILDFGSRICPLSV